jgi:solute carrier family 25 protein 33/36
MYRSDGIKSFYRGLTASYAGSIETAIYFVIYEKLKQQIRLKNEGEAHPIQCMGLAACSKITASSLCYPHEVCRTRLRQNVEPSSRKYHSFFQTLFKIWREEGRRGVYGGMTAHQLRVVPNTAIIFFSYEALVKAMGYITL